MARKRFLWSAHPIQGLLETWALALVMLYALSLLEGYVEPFVFGTATLMLCGTSGMWAVLRIRLPLGPARRQFGWELAVALAISAIMSIGLYYPGSWLGWHAIWTRSTWGAATINVFLVATGFGYLVARVGVRVWVVWDGMRRRHLRWELTHAHLLVVVMAAVLGALVVFLLSPFYSLTTGLGRQWSSPIASFAEKLIMTVFPAVSLIAVITVAALAAVLPPSALFSLLVARRTTRRLEMLAATATSFRKGDYASRVAVEGEDEVALLQADFNAMADDLERTLRDLRTQRDTVARLLEARRELVANVSHELRTPVATVRATLESSLGAWQGQPPLALKHDLEVMEGEVDRLQRLIDDLFTLAQSQAGGLSLECRPIDLGPLIRRMVDAIAPLAWTAGRVEVVAECDARLPSANADAGRLEQVLANLLRNAVRHTPPGGIVAVTAAAADGGLRVDVRDTGEGISPDDLPRIWDRFYQAEEQRSRDGVGLGLALVKELTEAMGGSVAVDTVLGQGSCFTIRLPAA